MQDDSPYQKFRINQNFEKIGVVICSVDGARHEANFSLEAIRQILEQSWPRSGEG